jgi:glucose/arabinose dehydrogenase
MIPADVVTGLNKPWDIAFLPGSTEPTNGMVFTENDARTVKLYNGTPTPVQLLLEGDVDIGGEGGMMGIAVHPSWPTTKEIFVCYTSNAGDNRVVKYTATTDPSNVPTALGSPVPIVTGMAKAGAHNGCRIRFQPGSSPPALFVTMGDATVGTTPQSASSLNGKVLRVTETGAPYPGNASGTRWFTKGHRNPQGITFDPLDGNRPWTAEHGPNVNDEVNKLGNGGNAGWDPIPGYNQGVPMTDIAKYPTALRPQWRSGTQQCAGTSVAGDPGCFTIAPSGLTFVESGAENWGTWSNSIILAMLKNEELRLLRLDSSRRITSQSIVYKPGTGERLRVPVQGPDGKLYVATDENPGRIMVFDPA